MRPWFGQPRLVLAAAVLEVEDGIPRLAVGVVAGRGVDEDAPPVLGRLREVPALADLAVRHVLRQVVVDALLRDLDPAGVLAGAVERLARGVVHLHAVDEHPVVVEARHHGVRGRGPEAVLALRRGVPLVVEEPEFDLLGVRRLDAEGDAEVVVDARVLRAPDVGRCGLALGGFRVLGRIGRGEQGQQAGEPQAVHREVSRVGVIATPSGPSHHHARAAIRKGSTRTIDVAPQEPPGPVAGTRACGQRPRDHSKPSTVAARTIGAERSLPFTSSMLAIVCFFPGTTVR